MIILKVRVLFEVELDDCINLIVLNKDEVDRVEIFLEDCICEVNICYNEEVVNIINLEEFKKCFGLWKGKYLFDGIEEVKGNLEGFIIVIDDVIDKI